MRLMALLADVRIVNPATLIAAPNRGTYSSSALYRCGVADLAGAPQRPGARDRPQRSDVLRLDRATKLPRRTTKLRQSANRATERRRNLTGVWVSQFGREGTGGQRTSRTGRRTASSADGSPTSPRVVHAVLARISGGGGRYASPCVSKRKGPPAGGAADPFVALGGLGDPSSRRSSPRNVTK